MTGYKKQQIRVNYNNLQSKTKNYSLNTGVILKKTFLNIFGAKSLSVPFWEKHNMQNIFEKSLQFGVAQASVNFRLTITKTAFLSKLLFEPVKHI